jgi:hypothetical protein
MPLIRRSRRSLLQRLRAWLPLTIDLTQPPLDFELSDDEIAEQLHYPHR